jgi:hypothetical protein
MIRISGEVRGVRHLPGQYEKQLLVIEGENLESYEIQINQDDWHNLPKYVGLKGKKVHCSVACSGFKDRVYFRLNDFPQEAKAPAAKAA